MEHSQMRTGGQKIVKEHFFTCPYCMQRISMIIDVSQAKQSYIEDCEVCCCPISINYETTEEEIVFFEAERTQ